MLCCLCSYSCWSILAVLGAVSVLLLPKFYKNVAKALLMNFGPLGLFQRKDVSGSVVLITGAGNGIGRLMALEFAKLRARLILWDIDERGVSEVAAECERLGARGALAQRVDLARREDVYRAADEAKSRVGHVDILVNNAGIGRSGPYLEKPDDYIEACMRVNCLSHFWTAKSFLPHMLATDSGHVVCIASAAALHGAASLVEYSGSKFAALGIQEALENEVYFAGKKHVQFTSVCPFYIQTKMLDDIALGSLFGYGAARAVVPICSVPQRNQRDILTPEYVVACIMDGILTNQRLVVIPGKLRLLLSFKSILPRRSFQQLTQLLQK